MRLWRWLKTWLFGRDYFDMIITDGAGQSVNIRVYEATYTEPGIKWEFPAEPPEALGKKLKEKLSDGTLEMAHFA